ncbi:unnamed protein product [Durusdinium trenchii]|uniref:Uncharacterized protein n=1 Tax=Durusdinium trenchii TaxID=1381693 RepID=A0ABP0JA98_9DINO
MQGEAAAGYLEQQLKTWRQSFEARKAARLGSERWQENGAQSVAQTPQRELSGNVYTPFSSVRSGRSASLPAPRLGSEVLQTRFSPPLDLNTPTSPVPNARAIRAYMLNACLSEPFQGSTLPQAARAPQLKDPGHESTVDRPAALRASPKALDTGIFVAQDVQFASPQGTFGASCLSSSSPSCTPVTQFAGVAATMTSTVAEDRLQRRLHQARAAMVRCDEELQKLAAEEVAEIEAENCTKARGEGLHNQLDMEQIEQELFDCKKRVARLEHLNKIQIGYGAEEAPSDASTSASFGVEDTWQQRAEALRDELLRQSAIVTELQDRIHWLRAQLRRQPGLQDKRMQEIVDTFAEMAEMVPKYERVAAIGQLLAEIANQATYVGEET